MIFSLVCGSRYGIRSEKRFGNHFCMVYFGEYGGGFWEFNKIFGCVCVLYSTLLRFYLPSSSVNWEASSSFTISLYQGLMSTSHL